MEWVERLENTLEYIETHLTEEISIKEIARIACCSEFHYQRIFSYMVGSPLSEYIRKRKISLAGSDLQSGMKVIDVAIKYGYDSPNSFARAFKQLQGFPPSQAQQSGTKLTSFPRIKFHISIRGDVEMEYRIEKLPAFRIVGAKLPLSQSMAENFKEVPAFWNQVATDGTLQKIMALNTQEPEGVLGISAGFLSDFEDPNYYIAVASNQPTPADLVEYQVNSFIWAIFTGEGPMPASIQELEKRIITDWLPSSGFEYDNGPDIELYLDNNPINAKFEVWIPIKKMTT